MPTPPSPSRPMRPSVAVLFRALGGAPATEIVPAPAAAGRTAGGAAIGRAEDGRTRRLQRRAAAPAAGDRRLPRRASSTAPPTSGSPRSPPPCRRPSPEPDRCRPTSPSSPPCRGRRGATLGRCPGPARRRMPRMCAPPPAAARRARRCRGHEAAVEARRPRRSSAPRAAAAAADRGRAPRGYRTFAPVPILLPPRAAAAAPGAPPAPDAETAPRAGAADRPPRKTGQARGPRPGEPQGQLHHPPLRGDHVLGREPEPQPHHRRRRPRERAEGRRRPGPDHPLRPRPPRRLAAAALARPLAAGRRARAAGRPLHLSRVEPPRPAPTCPTTCRVLEAEARAGRRPSPPTRASSPASAASSSRCTRAASLLPRQIDGADLDLDAAVRAPGRRSAPAGPAATASGRPRAPPPATSPSRS